MPERTNLSDRLQALENRVGQLERQVVSTGDHPEIETLGEKLAQRIADEGIDIEAQPVGQLEFSVLILNKGSNWSMGDSVTLEKLMGASVDSLAKSIGGLAHPVRIKLFKALLEGPQESSVLLEVAGLNTTGQLYHHLQAMADVGLVERRSRNHWAPQNLGAFAMLMGAGRILSDWRGEE